MSKYHDRTLLLLSADGGVAEQETPQLLSWAKTHGVELPAAYVEWARLDRTGLLQKCSEFDSLYFDEPRVVRTPQGAAGILFHEEQHGNFQKIVVLNKSDNPPVLYAWMGRPPWINYAEHFSDAIFAQVFDWQHHVGFAEAGRGVVIPYRVDMDLLNDSCVAALRTKFEESVKTRISDDREIYSEYRFFNPPAQRITATVAANGRTNLRAVGPACQIILLENELFDAFGDQAVLPEFKSLSAAIGHLSLCAGQSQSGKLRHSCIQMPKADAIERLYACNATLSLTERLRPEDFPKTDSSFEIGGDDWGIDIRFQRQNQTLWWIEAIL